MIPSDGVLGQACVARVGVAVVTGARARNIRFRRRKQLHDLAVDRVPQASRNLVAPKGSPLAVHHVEWVIDLRDLTEGSCTLQIAPSQSHRGDGGEVDPLEVVNESFEVGVEEGPVFDDRPTDRSPEDLVVDRELLALGPVGEEVGRIQRFIPEVVPGVTVELVAAALAEHADHGSSCLPVFGRVVVSDDLELLDRLGRGLSTIGRWVTALWLLEPSSVIWL